MQVSFRIKMVLLVLISISAPANCEPIPTDPDRKTRKDFLAGQVQYLVRDCETFARATSLADKKSIRSFVKQAAERNTYGFVNDAIERGHIEECQKAIRKWPDHPIVQLRVADAFINVGRIASANQLLTQAERTLQPLEDSARAYAECIGLLTYITKYFGRSSESEAAFQRNVDALIAYAEQDTDLADQRYVLDRIDGRMNGMNIKQKEALAKQLVVANKVNDWTRHMVLGRVHGDVAWNRRGGGYAHTVTSERNDKFSKHMVKAGEHFESAWKADPSKPNAASQLIAVSMAGGHEVATRTWFDRAVAAQMDYRKAYEGYLWSLRPRWGGSIDEMREFGEECRDTERYDTDVPLVYTNAILSITEEKELEKEQVSKEEFYEPVMKLFDRLAQDAPRVARLSAVTPRDQILSAQLNYALNWSDQDATEQLEGKLVDTYDPTFSRKLKFGSRSHRKIDAEVAIPEHLTDKIEAFTPKGSESREECMKMYGSLHQLYLERAETTDNDRQKRLFERRAFETKSRIDFYNGKRVPLTFDLTYGDWLEQGGEWTQDDDRTVEARLTAGSAGLRLWSHAPFHGPLEIQVQITPLESYGAEPRAGLIVGYLPHIYPKGRMPSETPTGRCFWIDHLNGMVGADFTSKCTNVYQFPAAKTYRMKVKAWAGFCVMYIDDEFVFHRKMPLFRPDGYIGLGSLSYTRSSNEVQFSNLIVRQLFYEAPPDDASDEALITYYSRVLELEPKDDWALTFRGAANVDHKDYSAAAKDLELVVDDNDLNSNLGVLLAISLGKLGRSEEAIALLEQRLDGNSGAMAANALAWLLSTSPDASVRDGVRAITLARKSCQAKEFTNPKSLDTLAAAYAETGDFDSAVRWQTKAIALSQDGEDKAGYEQRLSLFKSKKPFRQ